MTSEIKETNQVDESQATKVEKLKETLNIIAGLHQIMTTRVQFYPEEFQAVDKQLKFLVNFAKELDSKIVDLDPELKKKIEEEQQNQAKETEING